jgi:hypothetical protein
MQGFEYQGDYRPYKLRFYRKEDVDVQAKLPNHCIYAPLQSAEAAAA